MRIAGPSGLSRRNGMRAHGVDDPQEVSCRRNDEVRAQFSDSAFERCRVDPQDDDVLRRENRRERLPDGIHRRRGEPGFRHLNDREPQRLRFSRGEMWEKKEKECKMHSQGSGKRDKQER